ncbi:hypothetical protein [Desulfofustis limnaeus]|jgi:ATP/maltotriose-dependent transcriptional regulator MalT/DNA-binding SARP family transcriptional activator|uniref:MalT-like winged helix domain-containing protein n=1 Tax=Desulfofustis limnaeus TaxID=2740163 RepID=A0ABN6M9T4_9BACT|nr:hypothetical protein [Desulfofustis limnaeus]MDX9894455.1 hypothetical protein [Desulfofustis sp.]BDD88079.1 hypothetical protein DPPLL_24440 [Desulfofustis limnaeus]
MTFAPNPLLCLIPSNKFCPPRLNWSQSLPRHELIHKHVSQPLNAPVHIVIEAQAGQGKTTLAKQYLEYSGHAFVWYQIGAEDQDPSLLLSALQLALLRLSPAASNDFSPRGLIDSSLGDPESWQQEINMMLNLISPHINCDTFLVFDDLHVLDDAPRSRAILDYLIDTAPHQLHFIFTSRQPLQLQAKVLRNSPHLLYLDTDDLAMSPAEVEALYDCLLQTTISRAEAVHICRLTNGWIMGIVLAEHPFIRHRGAWFRNQSGPDSPHASLPFRDDYLARYFEDEVFSNIPEALRTTLYKLSFLDDIEVDLAQQFTTLDDLEDHLHELADKNFFVYRLDENGRTFRFHQLFREFLQACGRKLLSSNTIAAIQRQAANYYLANNRLSLALRAMHDNDDFAAMEAVLCHQGIQLLSPGRRTRIISAIRTLSAERTQTYPWITFCRGLAVFETDPGQALPIFQTCQTLFAAREDQHGELLARCRILNHQVLISGDYRLASPLLAETRTLFDRVHAQLPRETAIIAAQCLSSGYALCCGDLATAHRYGQWAAERAAGLNNENLIATARFALSCIALLSGNHRTVSSEIEKAFPFSCNASIGFGIRMALQIVQLTELSITGQDAALAYHRQDHLARSEIGGWRQDIMTAYLELYSAISLIGRGQHEPACARLNRGLHLAAVNNSNHLTSLFLQYRALAEALLGNRANALNDLHAAETAREKAGGPFFQSCQQIIGGATLALLGRYQEAVEKLLPTRTAEGGEATARTAACGLGYLAFIEHHLNHPTPMRTYLEEWLAEVSRSGYRCFWGFLPEVTGSLIDLAQEMKVEPVTAAHLARRLNRCHTATEGTIPLLDIKILGTCSLAVGAAHSCDLQDLTTHQRELFGQLISTPQQKISQEQVQLIFWPDSPPDKARKSFDTLMTRLRKTMSERLSIPARNYITVEKGYVRLINATIDAQQFLRKARHGLKQAEHDLWWQAGTLFAAALSYWTEFRPLQVFASDQAQSFQDELVAVLRSICLVWSQKLIALERDQEALNLLERTRRILLTDEDTVSLRYRLFLKLNNPLQAREVLQTYYRELVQIGWSEQEAEDLAATVAARPIRLT